MLRTAALLRCALWAVMRGLPRSTARVRTRRRTEANDLGVPQSFAVANLRRRPMVVESGSFVAGFDPGSGSPYINYATPLPGAEPARQDVAELIEAFRKRG